MMPNTQRFIVAPSSKEGLARRIWIGKLVEGEVTIKSALIAVLAASTNFLGHRLSPFAIISLSTRGDSAMGKVAWSTSRP